AIDYTYLRFPDQFNGISYNPDIPTEEDLSVSNTAYFNLGAGVFGMYTPNKQVRYGLGLSLYNSTQPNISFFENNTVMLPRRYLIYAMSHIEIRRDIDIIPAAKIQFQTRQHEYHFGAMVLHYTQSLRVPKITAGMWLRARDKDAVILGVGGLFNGYEVVLNYDVNISSLRTVSKGHGAIELTATYILTHLNRRQKMVPVKCPAYL
ncbi:MAG: type IX secretion system membrane protein PorP/SprF, partial [Bacteroidota bacterium]